jgi:hypothetical protein
MQWTKLISAACGYCIAASARRHGRAASSGELAQEKLQVPGDDGQEVVEVGVSLLGKPFSYSELALKVRQVLDGGLPFA